uniref:CSON011458 protein n=1 Tax=Culicoides sonorensis TaxID=179676 RepID=A0A336LU93_CULSO
MSFNNALPRTLPSYQYNQPKSLNFGNPSHGTIKKQIYTNDCQENNKGFNKNQDAVSIIPTSMSTDEDRMKLNFGNSEKNTDISDYKEKTPMCLVNELSRHNKITHQYRLTGETGPAHKKRFTVALKLGEEEYTAEGQSIKKAQHTAASEAIKNTKYPHPPPKLNKHSKNTKSVSHNITPTVELNALAMKRGIQIVYMQCNNNENSISYEDTLNKTQIKQQQSIKWKNKYNNSYKSNINNNKIVEKFQHNQLNEHINPYKVLLKVGEQVFEGTGSTSQAARHSAALRALEILKQVEQDSTKSITHEENDSKISLESKSPVSLLHEISVKKKIPVSFEILAEKGPPHMKIFITVCKAGNLVTEGEGNGKKISRKRAAEKMLNELKKNQSDLSLPSVTSNNEKLKKKNQISKKKNRNLIKEKELEEDQQVNPVSHLLQLQQSKKEREPEYTLIEEKGAPRKREFVIQVSIGESIATGTGPNKKIAKKSAAQNMLVQMGILKAKEKSPDEKLNNTKIKSSNKSKVQSGKQETNSNNKIKSITVGPKEQLLYLAKLLKFEVEFSDFPKGTHNDFLTLVTLATSPPQVCHGAGSTPEESNANAATKALELLRELGLDVITKKTSETKTPVKE